jgi:hypothetical protein
MCTLFAALRSKENLMKNLLMLSMKLPILLTVFTTLSVYAADSCRTLLGIGGATSILIGKYRQDRIGWTSLFDPRIEHSDSACGQVCAVNMVQIIRVAMGGPELKNPAKVVNELNSKNPAFKIGLTASQFTLALDQLLQEYVSVKTHLKYEALDSTVKSIAPKMTKTRTFNRNSLNINFNTAKILAYLAINPSGKIVGAHFVILAKSTENSIEVIDPNFPEHLLKMKIESIYINGNEQSLELIPLERRSITPAYGSDYRLILHGVATITLEI